MAGNSFGSHDRLTVGELAHEVFRLDRVDGAARLPHSLKVLLENLLRNEDGTGVTAEQVDALGAWNPTELRRRRFNMPQLAINGLGASAERC